MKSSDNNTKHTHGNFVFEDIAYKAVVYSRSLDRYFVSDALRVDSGLACLFGFENNGISEFDDLILCSEKFVSEIQENWWEQDWVHIGNVQYTGLKDKNGVEIYKRDILNHDDIYYVVDYEDGCYILTDKNRKSKRPLYALCYGFEVVGNEFENNDLLMDMS